MSHFAFGLTLGCVVWGLMPFFRGLFGVFQVKEMVININLIRCGRANRVLKIVGGVQTEENEYPWQVG